MAIWHNGTLSESASIDASSAGLLLGWGVFTTVGIKMGRAMWFEQHLHRLRRDAARCDITIPFSDEELCDGLTALLGANEVDTGMVRLTATRCDDGRWNMDVGGDVTILALQTAPAKTRGLRVGFAPAPSQGELTGTKTTSYLPYFWSWRQAQKRGLDEVILLNQNLIVEAARSSVFWVKDHVLQTSPLSLGALDGIGRALVLEWAKTAGIETRVPEVAARDWLHCDEAFLVSAATGPRSIISAQLSESEGEISLPATSPTFEALREWWDQQ